jgi:tetratricopeptide (TPR) repeat protein
VYLCFKNPSSLEGVFVTIEVSAIVAMEEYVDVWSTVSKQNLSTECLNSFLNKNETAKQICSCRTDKIIKKYTPKAYNAFSQNEKTLILKNELNACYNETENISLNDRIKSIEEEIRGFSAVKDYKKLILKYEELISLGVENDTIYNAIGHYNLLTKNFKKAKEYLTIGLGKNANNLLLQSNLAHYYLFTGEVKNAENIYLKYAKSKITKKTTWKDVIKADFELFESLGFNKSDLDGIREVLRIKN